jgi:hypothetical protein
MITLLQRNLFSRKVCLKPEQDKASATGELGLKRGRPWAASHAISLGTQATLRLTFWMSGQQVLSSLVMTVLAAAPSMLGRELMQSLAVPSSALRKVVATCARSHGQWSITGDLHGWADAVIGGKEQLRLPEEKEAPEQLLVRIR